MKLLDIEMYLLVYGFIAAFIIERYLSYSARAKIIEFFAGTVWDKTVYLQQTFQTRYKTQVIERTRDTFLKVDVELEKMMGDGYNAYGLDYLTKKGDMQDMIILEAKRELIGGVVLRQLENYINMYPDLIISVIDQYSGRNREPTLYLRFTFYLDVEQASRKKEDFRNSTKRGEIIL